MTVRPILVATDFSAPADEAIRWAHERAGRDGTRLCVCHVVPEQIRVNLLFPQRNVQVVDSGSELEQKAQRALVQRTRELTGRESGDFDALVAVGTPYAEIIGCAERIRAELVVVAASGATGLSRMLLGSVAEQVVRYAHAPVAVVRPAARTGRVLVGTDLSDPSLPALAAAAREARRPGVRVTALHCIALVDPVLPEYDMVWTGALDPELLKQGRERARRELSEALARIPLEAETSIVEGAAAPEIVSCAEELGAELVIVATRGRSGLSRVVLGSVAESVVRHAPCPVLVVRLSSQDAVGEDAAPRARPAGR